MYLSNGHMLTVKAVDKLIHSICKEKPFPTYSEAEVKLPHNSKIYMYTINCGRSCFFWISKSMSSAT